MFSLVFMSNNETKAKLWVLERPEEALHKTEYSEP